MFNVKSDKSWAPSLYLRGVADFQTTYSDYSPDNF